ncbi:MAG TPA: acyl-CoA dehydrogenase [Sporichthyaceae bacterium]|nr:acyl-CoA dehydrogenase [Sporichthyaceae bacterium]
MTLDTERAGLIAELRAAVRDVCADLGGPTVVRTLGPGAAWDAKAWSVLSEQVGIAALGLPGSADGIGGVPEIAAVAEELGAALLPVPFLTSTVMAGQVLARCGPAAGPVLTEIAAGRQTAVTASLISRDGTGPVVPDAAGARWLVAQFGEHLELIDLRQDGVVVEPAESLDLSRPAARVRVGDVMAIRLSDDGSAVMSAAMAVARVAVAAEQLGGAQECLDRTVAYVKERRQFGRAVGSFQAVKHTLADMLVQVEMARSAVGRAVEVHDDPDALAEAALVARIWCSDAYRFVSAEAVQLHGGIGFTWEHDAHLYFRRARADAALLGSGAVAREELADLLAW